MGTWQTVVKSPESVYLLAVSEDSIDYTVDSLDNKQPRSICTYYTNNVVHHFIQCCNVVTVDTRTFAST